jgi:hypothetical protein
MIGKAASLPFEACGLFTLAFEKHDEMPPHLVNWKKLTGD